MQEQMKQPDIEIYVKDVSFEAIQKWLSEIFNPITLPKVSDKPVNIKVEIPLNAEVEIPVMITPKAAGKAFTSIWFQSDKTPWLSDEACANSFLEFQDAEVRCSANSWHEEEDEQSDQWLSINRNEKRLIRWG